jgi:MSHA biogenesis protein MshO
MSEQAGTALAVMRRDIRLAVPNSIRTPGTACFELVPTSAGGRFRKITDTVNAGAMPLDLAAGTSTTFDVFNDFVNKPGSGDFIVVDNQNPNDVYSGANRVALTAAPAAPVATLGKWRLTTTTALSIPGYDGGRYVVVPASQQAVFYVCSGAGSTGSEGTGTLTRYSRYGFNGAYPGACGNPGGTAAVLATHVSSCRFIYDPNQGATQQSGFVAMQLALQRNGETVSLMMGAHVQNVP